MHDQLQLLGWKSIRKKLLEFYACPSCGKTQEMIWDNEGGLVDCHRCNTAASRDTWTAKKVLRSVTICAGCKSDIPLTSSYASMGGPFFICHHCSNAVAVYLGRRFISPTHVLSFGWAKNLRKRAIRIPGSGCHVAECRTKSDHLVVTLLVRLAQNEAASFKYGSEPDRALLCMNNKQYIGFVRWSDGEDKKQPVVRQIFVIPQMQRRGIGTALMRHWAEKYAFPFTEKFGVESPNEKSYGVLEKLGYVELDRKGNRVKFIRCYRTGF